MDTDNQKTIPLWISEHFASFENSLNGQKALPVHALRQKALEEFKKCGIPTQKMEEWKYTSLRHLSSMPLKLLANQKAIKVTKPKNLPSIYEELDGVAIRLVFVNGMFNSDLSDDCGSLNIDTLDKVIHDPKHELHAFCNEKLSSISKLENNAFVALNSAFILDGIVLDLKEGQQAEKPIYLLNVTSDENIANYPRVLVRANKNSKARMVHHYYSESDKEYITNSVSEFEVLDNAFLEYVVLQEEGENATHITAIDSIQKGTSNFKTVSLSFGSKLSRNEIRPIIDSEKCFTEMLGLSVLDSNQHVDNATIIDHAKPNSESHELYKGVYADKSKGIFSGTIIVREDAQLTNAIQSNQGLLISDNAACYARPQLKIWADDVKCTHGATVGQLDEEALFYLMSRGIKKSMAKAILIKAFMHEIVSNIEDTELVEYAENKMFAKLDSNIS